MEMQIKSALMWAWVHKSESGGDHNVDDKVDVRHVGGLDETDRAQSCRCP